MKITRTYEVWTGGDMVEDFIGNVDYVIKLAAKELKENPDTDVVVDEIIHYELTSLKQIPELENEL